MKVSCSPINMSSIANQKDMVLCSLFDNGSLTRKSVTIESSSKKLSLNICLPVLEMTPNNDIKNSWKSAWKLLLDINTSLCQSIPMFNSVITKCYLKSNAYCISFISINLTPTYIYSKLSSLSFINLHTS